METPKNDNDEQQKEVTDQEFVDFLIPHLQEPCRTEAGNLRSFYIREAENALQKIKDPLAYQRLESALKIAKLVLKAEEQKP